MSKRTLAAYAAALLLINLLIAGKLFTIEYTAHLGSIEGTFIALARAVARDPLGLAWWPLWDCGLPFQNTYMPLLPVMAGLVSRSIGLLPSVSYYHFCAVFFAMGPVALYFMSAMATKRPHVSAAAALAYSVISPSALLFPAIRGDLGGAFYVRRLQTLVVYGEGPNTASLAILPLAMMALYLAVTRREFRLYVLAGFLCAVTVLFNAFGAVLLAFACAALLATGRVASTTGLLASIGIASYLWISPFVPPSVFRAIKINAPTVGGDFRYTGRTLYGWLMVALVFGLTWVVTRRLSPQVRFFTLFTALVSGVAVLAFNGVYVLPQPHRYHLAMDMGLCVLGAFAGATVLERFRWKVALAGALALVFGWQFYVNVRYARRLIQGVDVAATGEYRMAKWMEAHMGGRRVMLPGSYSFHSNAFADVPQLHGGHEPMLPGYVLRHAVFVIYSGMNTGAQDAYISTLWLRALGAHAIAVPGPGSQEYYKPIANPRKFEGVLPVLWRDRGDTVYGVPARSRSLAHVVPANALVEREPIHGMDVQGIERYTRALEDPAMPLADFSWRNWHTASIDTNVQPGQAVSVQVTYHPGWRASVNGAPVALGRDGLGLMVLRPPSHGPAKITLEFDGGPEWRITLLLSALVTAGTIAGTAISRSGSRRRRGCASPRTGSA